MAAPLAVENVEGLDLSGAPPAPVETIEVAAPLAVENVEGLDLSGGEGLVGGAVSAGDHKQDLNFRVSLVQTNRILQKLLVCMCIYLSSFLVPEQCVYLSRRCH